MFGQKIIKFFLCFLLLKTQPGDSENISFYSTEFDGKRRWMSLRMENRRVIHDGNL